MIRNIFILFVILWASEITHAQRVSLGITAGVPAFHRIEFPDQYLNPQNSYLIYYTANGKKDGEPVWDQYVNGIMGGLNFNLDYKRWMLTVEVLGESVNMKVPMNDNSSQKIHL